MKWDYASVIVWGLDEKGIDGVIRFDKAVVELAGKLAGEIESCTPLNGYGYGVKIARGDELLVQCFTQGSGGAQGSSQFVAASSASEVYPLLQAMYPTHSVSRLDAAEDYSGPGAWEKLESMLTKICTDNKVSMSPFGEGHQRPDGTRDATKGRSWYCGSKASPFRIVLYEKGLEELAKGIPSDPTKVRLECRVRPSSKAKQMVGSMNLKPMDILGFSRWGAEVAAQMGITDLERVAIGSVWKPGEKEQLALKIVRMFDNGIEQLLEQNTPEELGQLIAQAHKRNREAKAALQDQRGFSVEYA